MEHDSAQQQTACAHNHENTDCRLNNCDFALSGRWGEGGGREGKPSPAR